MKETLNEYGANARQSELKTTNHIKWHFKYTLMWRMCSSAVGQVNKNKNCAVMRGFADGKVKVVGVMVMRAQLAVEGNVEMEIYLYG